jgi:magnesium-transporting ATPase (P-type)
MADALLGLARFRWFAFRHSPLSQHRDPAMARPLLDAAAAEPESLLSRMGTTPQGLTTKEAAVRLRAVGPNLVAHERRQSLFAELVGRARNPLNFLLLSLAAVSYFLGDRRAAAVITVMVVLSVTLAFVQQQTAHLNADGFRVISVAYKEIAEPRLSYQNEDEGDLTLLGYIAFLDPPKESAGIAIATLARSGVQVKILTGDNDIIARKICREVGVVTDDVLIGGDLDKLTDEELAQRLETATLCAKVSPAQKGRIIAALHLRDHVVGFLGDGINDGPALT